MQTQDLGNGRAPSDADHSAGPPVGAVVFDLDDTLAPSKSPMADEMAQALAALLGRVHTCIISGGRYEQFEAQVLARLDCPAERLERLHLMPTCGTRYYRHRNGGWHLEYAEDLSGHDKARIAGALEEAARGLGLWAEASWGPVIEDRASQVTYSALGQSAPLAAKSAWDPDGSKKEQLRARVAGLLPDLEVRSGGSTSIDVTRRGIDKAYGMRRLADPLGVPLEEMLFVGDRLDPGGNDHPVRAMGVRCLAVKGWEQTLDLVTELVRFWDRSGHGLPETRRAELLDV